MNQTQITKPMNQSLLDPEELWLIKSPFTPQTRRPGDIPATQEIKQQTHYSLNGRWLEVLKIPPPNKWLTLKAARSLSGSV